MVQETVGLSGRAAYADESHTGVGLHHADHVRYDHAVVPGRLAFEA
ncbi:MAG: hypothetical protein ACK55I_05525 [bacterium]